MPLVEFDRQGHVAVITLNRPDARNAINPEVAVRLAEAWQQVKDDDGIRVAVLTGTGSAFCAGADLGQLIPMMSGARQPENEWDEQVAADPGITSRALLRNFDPEKPVIAAINGHAIAGGMELVQGTDLRVSAPGAKFGVQEVKWAIFPAGGSTVRLPVQLPYAKAMELLLTGELISAEQALKYGFLNYVTEDVMDKALERDHRRQRAAGGQGHPPIGEGMPGPARAGGAQDREPHLRPRVPDRGRAGRPQSLHGEAQARIPGSLSAHGDPSRRAPGSRPAEQAGASLQGPLGIFG